MDSWIDDVLGDRADLAESGGSGDEVDYETVGKKRKRVSKTKQTALLHKFHFRWSFSEKHVSKYTLDAFKAVKGALGERLRQATHAKAKYVYQLECTVVPDEKGSHENWHYQGFLNMSPKKTRETTIAKLLQTEYPGIHFQPCVDELALKSYCMKQDHTYRDGPWTDKLPLGAAVYKGADLPTYEEMYPFQKAVVDSIKQPCSPKDRGIDWIYDPHTGQGKSKLGKYIVWKRMGKYLSYMKHNDAMHLLFKWGPQPVYVVNLPYSKPKESSMHDIYTMLEQIKDGQLVSGKFDGDDMLYDPPHVWVFANFHPNLKAMAPGRFRVHTIDPHSKQLIPYKKNELLVAMGVPDEWICAHHGVTLAS